MIHKNSLSEILSKFNITNFSFNIIENTIKITNFKQKNFEKNEISNFNLNNNITNLKKKKNFNFLNIQKNNFFNSSIDISVINERLNYDIMLMIFDQCQLDPKPQGSKIRLRICPLCEKPHNQDPTNMNTCSISSENKLFNGFRCGSKGHVIRILRVLEKKYNNEIVKDILNPDKLSGDSENNSKRRN